WHRRFRILSDQRYRSRIEITPFALCQEDAQSVNPALGVDVACLLEQEGDVLLLAEVMHLSGPLHLHPLSFMKYPGHSASCDPSNPCEIDVSHALHERLNADEAQWAWDRPQGIDECIRTAHSAYGSKPGAGVVSPIVPVGG